MIVVGQEKRIFTFAKKREIALLLPLLPGKNDLLNFIGIYFITVKDLFPSLVIT